MSGESSGGGENEDPADMMRVFGNEEALFMTLSENGFKDDLESEQIADDNQGGDVLDNNL